MEKVKASVAPESSEVAGGSRRPELLKAMEFFPLHPMSQSEKVLDGKPYRMTDFPLLVVAEKAERRSLRFTEQHGDVYEDEVEFEEEIDGEEYEEEFEDVVEESSTDPDALNVPPRIYMKDIKSIEPLGTHIDSSWLQTSSFVKFLDDLDIFDRPILFLPHIARVTTLLKVSPTPSIYRIKPWPSRREIGGYEMFFGFNGMQKGYEAMQAAMKTFYVDTLMSAGRFPKDKLAQGVYVVLATDIPGKGLRLDRAMVLTLMNLSKKHKRENNQDIQVVRLYLIDQGTDYFAPSDALYYLMDCFDLPARAFPIRLYGLDKPYYKAMPEYKNLLSFSTGLWNDPFEVHRVENKNSFVLKSPLVSSYIFGLNEYILCRIIEEYDGFPNLTCLGRTVEAEITYIPRKPTGTFYAIINTPFVQHIKEIMANELEALEDNVRRVGQYDGEFQPQEMVLVCFHDPQRVCRAKVIQVLEHTLFVRLIDSGEQRYVQKESTYPVDWGHMVLKLLPPMATVCHVADFNVKDKEHRTTMHLDRLMKMFDAPTGSFLLRVVDCKTDHSNIVTPIFHFLKEDNKTSDVGMIELPAEQKPVLAPYPYYRHALPNNVLAYGADEIAGKTSPKPKCIDRSSLDNGEFTDRVLKFTLQKFVPHAERIRKDVSFHRKNNNTPLFLVVGKPQAFRLIRQSFDLDDQHRVGVVPVEADALVASMKKKWIEQDKIEGFRLGRKLSNKAMWDLKRGEAIRVSVNGEFERGEILQRDENGRYVVYLVDKGMIEDSVSFSRLSKLHLDERQLPACGIRAILRHEGTLQPVTIAEILQYEGGLFKGWIDCISGSPIGTQLARIQVTKFLAEAVKDESYKGLGAGSSSEWQ